MDGKCEICGCETPLTKHHLVPVHVCRSAKYGRELKTDDSNLIWICRPCHDQIHARWTDQQLRDSFYTKSLIMSDDGFAKFVAWRRKHPDFNGSSKMSNKRKR